LIHAKAHPHAASAVGSNQDMGSTKKRGDKHEATSGRECGGMPVIMIITEGILADCTQAESLIDGVNTKYLLAGRGYDRDIIVNKAEAQGTNTVTKKEQISAYLIKKHTHKDIALKMLFSSQKGALMRDIQGRKIAKRYTRLGH
jgi:hypothetical protein